MVNLEIGKQLIQGHKKLINLLFFGRLGEFAQDVSQSYECSGESMTPLAIREKLTLESEALGQELSEPQVLVAVNKMIVKWDHIVRDGDEIAFLPPVTGG